MIQLNARGKANRNHPILPRTARARTDDDYDTGVAVRIEWHVFVRSFRLRW